MERQLGPQSRRERKNFVLRLDRQPAFLIGKISDLKTINVPQMLGHGVAQFRGGFFGQFSLSVAVTTIEEPDFAGLAEPAFHPIHRVATAPEHAGNPGGRASLESMDHDQIPRSQAGIPQKPERFRQSLLGAPRRA